MTAARPGAIRRAVAREEAHLLRFLRDIVALPSPPGGEEEVARRAAQEMGRLGLDRVVTDPCGNVLGTLGRGSLEILYVAPMDTRRVAREETWSFHPCLGPFQDGRVFGLGTAGGKGALAAMLTAARVLARLGPPAGVTLHVAAAVLSHECPGFAARALLHGGLVAPRVVLLGAPTGLALGAGHRGGISGRILLGGGEGGEAEAARQSRGDRLLRSLEELVPKLPQDPFLGPATLEAGWEGVAHEALWVRRRVTAPEDPAAVLRELAARVEAGGGTLRVDRYDRPTYTGQILEVERVTRPWRLAEREPLARAAAQTAAVLPGLVARFLAWDGETEGAYTAGTAGLPTLGLGPGREEDARRPNEGVALTELLAATAFFALLPHVLAESGYPGS